MDGRFCLGLGSGEALNEHIFGDPWPEADERLEMLEEAIEVIRLLWKRGVAHHRGRHYRLEQARVYDLPKTPPPILVSGFGPKAAEFEQAAELVTEDMVAQKVTCGADVESHVEALAAYEQAGFDELDVDQIGPEQEGFFTAYRDHILPRFNG